MRPHLHRHARAARRCQGQRLGSKARERIKHEPSLGGGRFQGAARGEEGGMEPGPPGRPWTASSHPFPELQPLLSPSEQELRVLEFSYDTHTGLRTRTRAVMGTESTRRNRGCTQQEVKKCPFPEEMKELSPELSAPKGAGALSAGVSQSLSKSPIYIKMPFQTCFDFTFPLSSPSPSRPTSQPHCPRSTRSGPSALPAGKEQERKKRAGN